MSPQKAEQAPEQLKDLVRISEGEFVDRREIGIRFSFRVKDLNGDQAGLPPEEFKGTAPIFTFFSVLSYPTHANAPPIHGDPHSFAGQKTAIGERFVSGEVQSLLA